MTSKFDLAEAFASKQGQLLAELRSANVVSHPTDKGDISEDAWRYREVGSHWVSTRSEQ